MKRTSLIRLGGLAAMVGAVLFVAGSSVDLAGYLLAFYYPMLYNVALVVALLQVPVGMVSFHALQRHSYGRKGCVGFWLVVVGSLVVLLGGVVFFTLGNRAISCRPRRLSYGWDWGCWGWWEDL